MPFSTNVFEPLALVVGLLFGSFLNVCISRLPFHESVVKPRSRCPRCLATIAWYDNIPVLSWALLRAKCRSCQASIPLRYPMVEVSYALWIMWSAHVAGFSYLYRVGFPIHEWLGDGQTFFGLAICGFLLIGLLVMDWQTHSLPDAFTFPGILIGFLLLCVQAAMLPTGEGDIKFNPKHSLRLSSPGSFAAKGNVFLTGTESMVLERLGAILAAAGIILIIRFAYRKIRGHHGLGLGDAKLMAMIAAFLGCGPAMLALFLGIITCAIYAITLLSRRRATGASALPLGTFLCVGGLVSALFGAPIITWYTSLLH